MTSQNYSFNHWELCFDDYQNFLKSEGENICLIISTHPLSSGYFIEDADAKLTKGDYKYMGDEVLKLKDRIEKETTLAKAEGRHPRFIL